MHRRRNFLALLLVLAAGCSGITTQANVAPGANLNRYHTYGWYKTPNEPQSLAQQELRAALERQLAQKGLTPATTTAPDFLVAYHATQQQKTQVTPGYYGGYAWGYGYGWRGLPDVTTYTEGTLVVDFIDPQTNSVFWRGTAQGVVEHPANPDLHRIDTAVAKLVDQYPTQMAAAPRTTM